MKLFIKKKIGKVIHTFEVSGNNLHEIIMESQKLSFNDVHKCDWCQSDNLILNARKAQDKYKYTEVKCLDCHSSLVFGQTQENPDVFYLRKNEDKKYAWKQYNPENKTQPAF